MKTLVAILVATLLALPGVLAAEGAAPPAALSVQGEVLEVLDGGAFTYLRLHTASGEAWVVVRRASVVKGAQVTVEDPELLQHFESKALQRRFDAVVFGTLKGATGATAAAGRSPHGAPAGTVDPAQAHGSPVRARDAVVAKVARAEGGDARTVAEVYAERLTLRDRPVSIRATVTNVTAGVMGRNWIHLRDGSGYAADGSDDIVATSQDEPKVGDVVVARGTVKTDVNLGSGYAYRVLVEDASFRK
jgi:hypothetical protein